MLNELFKSKLSGTVEPTEGISQSSTGIRKKKDGSLIVPIICSSKEKADKSLEDNPTLPDDVGKTKNDKVCTDNEQPNPKDSEITSSLPAVSPTIVDIIPCENRYEGIKLKLPKGWEEKDGWIYSNGKPATEFIIRSKSRRTHTSRNGESKLTVRCDLIAKDKKAEIDIPYDDLQNGKFKKHLPDGFVVFNVLDKPLEKLLCNSMLQTMADLPNEKTTCFSFGYNIINGQHIFNTGNRLINGEEINNWISTSDTIMKYVEPKPIDTYKKWISEFLESSNYPPVLLVAALVPYVFPLIDKSKRVHYEFGGYIVGKSGCGKTEIAKLLVTPFTDNCNMISLSSDRDAIHHMSAFNNCSVLFDDLNASDSDEIRRKKETKVSEIIETLQSVGKSVKEGKNTKIRALPFITAEYTLKRESLINRCLIVNIDKSFRPKSLTWLQENHDTYISFINSFIEFICKNYQMLHDYINNCLSSEKYHMKKNKGISGWTRVSNIKFVLDITLDILMAFLDIDCNKTISVFSYDNRFIESINKCVEYTLDLIKEQKKIKTKLLSQNCLKIFGILNQKS